MDFTKILLYALSPELRKLIVEFVISLSDIASTSGNPLDKIIIGVFKQLLDIKE